MSDKKYWVGSILLVLAFLACVISYYLIVFALPVFLVGAVIILFSRQTILKKLLTIIVPLVLWLPCTYAFLYLYNYPSPMTILVPEGFEGTLRIVFEEKCGVVPAEVDGREVLDLTKSPILILNREFADGIIDHEYYLIGADNKRRQLKNTANKTTGTPGVELGSSGRIYLDGEKEILIMDIYVYKDNLSDIERYDPLLDSLTKAVVMECRKRPSGQR